MGNTLVNWNGVEVSIIRRGSDSTRFIAFYQPGEPGRDNERQVENMWNVLIENARNYQYAEQAVGEEVVFRGNFQHWPDSRYMNPPENNSNTFARWMANLTGQLIPDLYTGSAFPGAHLPIQYDGNNYFEDPQSYPAVLRGNRP